MGKGGRTPGCQQHHKRLDSFRNKIIISNDQSVKTIFSNEFSFKIKTDEK